MIHSPFTGHNKQLTLAGQSFNSPAALTNHLKRLKNTHPLRQPFNGDDDSLLREWITFHPDAKSKIGAGIKHFVVDTHSDYGKPERCIFIHHLNGAVVDVSYKEPSNALVQLYKRGSLSRNPYDLIRDYKAALRRSVAEQVNLVKHTVFRDQFAITCPLSGELITFTEAEVDHSYPMTFDAIAWHWSLIWDINPQDVELNDLGTSFELIDQSLADSFAGFHLESANLQVISKAVNNTAKRFPVDWSIYL